MRTRGRVRSCLLRALVVVVGAILVSLTSTEVRAQQTGGLPALEKRVTTLEQTIGNLTAQIAALQAALNQEIADRQAADAALQARVAALEQKTQFVSVAGGEMFVTGTNLHIVNGLGSTATTNSLGNLIVGYNEGVGYKRTGSHNIVTGDANSYTSYGGVVHGTVNVINGPYASVTGGTFSIAEGESASVSGGFGNLASGTASSITGGQNNFAGAFYSTVSGGFLNQATGFVSSVSGGGGNKATGDNASVSGGIGNEASGDSASVSGGEANQAVGHHTSVSGGRDNHAYGPRSSISGGALRIQVVEEGWSAGSVIGVATVGDFESP